MYQRKRKKMNTNARKTKVFCIGYNKTGTTSVENVLQSLGYKMHHANQGLRLLDHWVKRDFNKIAEFCKTADAFQDIPFSLDYTYIAMDQAFPRSKFILTVRNNEDEWYNSWIKFIKKIFGKNRMPTVEEIRRFEPLYWEFATKVYGVTEETIYDHATLTKNYLEHNRKVLEYFRYRQEDLLVVNIADENAMKKIYDFLGYPYKGEKMPHLNASGQ